MPSAYHSRWPGGVEQVGLGEVRGVHELVPGGHVPLPRVVLEHPPDDAALGVEHRQPAADLRREREQVQLGAELAVIAALGLGQHGQVLVLRVAGRPGGAVDPLQLRVLLAPPPVRAAAAHHLQRRDVPGGRHVRAAAQVLPLQLAGGRVEVVVDRQFRAADLDRLLGVDPAAALEPDQFQLVRLAGQLGPGLGVGDHPAGEPLTLLDDLAHSLLDVLKIAGLERRRHVEVVVEAVLDRRADPELGLRGHVLNRLGHDVGGGVPHDGQPGVAAELDRLHHVAVGQRARQVAQLAIDPRCDHVTGARCRVPGNRRQSAGPRAPGPPSSRLPPRARVRRG